MRKPVLQRNRHYWDITMAWPDMRPVLTQPDFRMLALAATMVWPALLIADVAAGLLKHAGLLAPEIVSVLRLSEEASIAEFAGCIATQMAVFFILWIAYGLMSPLHALLGVLLEYLLLDDMFGLHEAAGRELGQRWFSSQTMFPEQALGELSFGLLFGVFALALLARQARTATHYHRSLCSMLVLPMLMMAFCAVGMDFVHALVPREAKFLNGFAALLEDGGELLAMILLMLVAAAQWIALPDMVFRQTAAVTSP